MEGKDFNYQSDLKAKVSFDCSENTGVSSVIIKDEILPDLLKSESNKCIPDGSMEDDGNEDVSGIDPEYTDCTATQFCFVGIKTEMPDDYDSELENENVGEDCLKKAETTNCSSPGIDVKIEVEEDIDKCESDVESEEDGLVKIDRNCIVDSYSEPKGCDEMGHSSKEFIRGIECQEYPILCVKSEEKIAKQFDNITKIDTAFQESSGASKTLTKPPGKAYKLERRSKHDLDSVLCDTVRSETCVCDDVRPLGANCSVHFSGSLDVANCTSKEGARQGLNNSSEFNLFLCNICNQSFTESDMLKKHKYIHSGENQFICGICGATFSTNGNLKTHQLIHTGIKPISCDICGATFSQRRTLRTHMLIHTGNKPFMCDICGASFFRNWDLKTHKRSHAGIKPFKCDVCGTSFSHKSNLTTHNRIHTGIKPFKCDVCGVSFSQQNHLKTHKHVHSGIKPFSCDICGATFSQKRFLKTHSRIHAEIKPFKCDTCGSAFSHRGSLRRHMLIHTEDKPFKCDVCGASFSDNSNLKRHKHCHSGVKPFSCDICGVSFSQKYNLEAHTHTHSSIKPFSCDICGTTFTQKRILKTHVRIHADIKPFKCGDCGASFSYNSNLRRHMRSHTAD